MHSCIDFLISFHAAFVGPSEIPSLHVQKKVGSSARGIPRMTDMFHASSDVSLFSSSLPVLPHEKCKLEIMFLISEIGISQNDY